jgi:hypothetical protein
VSEHLDLESTITEKPASIEWYGFSGKELSSDLYSCTEKSLILLCRKKPGHGQVPGRRNVRVGVKTGKLAQYGYDSVFTGVKK